jgi:hypothetical protein
VGSRAAHARCRAVGEREARLRPLPPASRRGCRVARAGVRGSKSVGQRASHSNRPGCGRAARASAGGSSHPAPCRGRAHSSWSSSRPETSTRCCARASTVLLTGWTTTRSSSSSSTMAARSRTPARSSPSCGRGRTLRSSRIRAVQLLPNPARRRARRQISFSRTPKIGSTGTISPGLARLVETAALVIIGTEPLREAISERARRVVVVPNALDERLWHRAPARGELGPGTRLLFFGTRNVPEAGTKTTPCTGTPSREQRRTSPPIRGRSLSRV